MHFKITETAIRFLFTVVVVVVICNTYNRTSNHGTKLNNNKVVLKSSVHFTSSESGKKIKLATATSWKTYTKLYTINQQIEARVYFRLFPESEVFLCFRNLAPSGKIRILEKKKFKKSLSSCMFHNCRRAGTIGI